VCVLVADITAPFLLRSPLHVVGEQVGRRLDESKHGTRRVRPRDANRAGSGNLTEHWSGEGGDGSEDGEQRYDEIGESCRGKAVQQPILQVNVERNPRRHARQVTVAAQHQEPRLLTAVVP